MRLFARPRDARFRGSVHALRSAYNRFTLVEPFPNGKMYFKRVVDRPVCVYVIEDRLAVLASTPQAFRVVPAARGSFHLRSTGGFYSPGDYVDGDTCLPTADWTEAKAWECFCLVDAPALDQRERELIAHIDGLSHRRCEDARSGGDALVSDIRQQAAYTSACGDNGSFDGSVDICRPSHAAGWAARGRDPAVVSIYVDGTKVGHVHPSGERPDVAYAGFARFSAWSFVFPRPLVPDQRVAFRFPDGSPLPFAADGDQRRMRIGGIAHAA